MIVYQSKYSENSIRKIVEYISEEGYPERAIKYILRLQKFMNSLVDFPDKYALCKQHHFAKRNFHCAVFEKTYILIYKIKPDGLFVYNIIHCSRMK